MTPLATLARSHGPPVLLPRPADLTTPQGQAAAHAPSRSGPR